jgi:hypothetical protein
VDISKIQGPIKTVTFGYRFVGRGSSEAEIRDGVDAAALTAQFLSDALGDLSRAVLTLLQGLLQSKCSWQEEPGEYRWLFEQRSEHLHIRIIWFDDTFSRQLDQRGKLIFESECQLRQFAVQMRDELERLLAQHGEAGYKSSWVNHDFPLPELEKLNQLLAEAERG